MAESAAPTPSEPDLAQLCERLLVAIRETKEAVAASKALKAETEQLSRYAHEVLRQANLRRHELFQGASSALAELEALSRGSVRRSDP